MERFKRVFKNTYQLPGGARAFWLMVLGCIAAIVLPLLIKNQSISMIVICVPAFLAIVNGGMFSTTMAQFMMAEVEEEQAKRKNHRHKK